MTDKTTRAVERVIVPMRPKLIERIDDFRFTRRMPSRAEAIRQLIESGLNCSAQPAQGKPRPSAKS